MRAKLTVGAVLLSSITLLLSPSPLAAHHAFAAEFDEKKPVHFEDATVTKVELINPHSWIHVDVKMPDGTVENFAATFAQQQSYPAGSELDGHIYYHYMPAGYQSGVLTNDMGPAGSTLSAILVSGPQHGSLSLGPDGSFVYSPATNYTGVDTFTYQASSGQLLSNVATVTLNVQADVANPGGPYTVNVNGCFAWGDTIFLATKLML